MKRGKDYIGVGVGSLLINDRHEVLLVKRKKPPEAGTWSLPGGAVEQFETLQDALKRELREELGIDTEIISSVGVIDHIIQTETLHWVSVVYLVKILKGIPQNSEPEKHEALGWFSLGALPSQLATVAAEAIDKYRNQL